MGFSIGKLYYYFHYIIIIKKLLFSIIYTKAGKNTERSSVNEQNTQTKHKEKEYFIKGWLIYIAG